MQNKILTASIATTAESVPEIAFAASVMLKLVDDKVVGDGVGILVDDVVGDSDGFVVG